MSAADAGLIEGIDADARAIAVLSLPPTGFAYVTERDGHVLVRVIHAERDVFVNEFIPGRSWFVTHRRSGFAFLLHGSKRLAKKHARALARVDDWFERVRSGDVSALRAIQRLNRIYSILNRGTRRHIDATSSARVSGASAVCPGPFRTLGEAKKFGLVFDVPRRHCRWCGEPCKGRRSSFCSGLPTKYRRGHAIVEGSGCVHEWMLRTDPSYLRAEVFRRDRGICKACGTDAAAMKDLIWRFPSPAAAERKKLPLTACDIFSALGFMREEAEWGSGLWHADHIVPVEKGGGLCGLDGMQTLCAPCHRRKSAAERRSG